MLVMFPTILVIFGALCPYTFADDAVRKKCSDSQFWCNEGTCIELELKCNGVLDCPDGSDEDFSNCWSNECGDDQFHCTYGACVRGNATCDGVRDCADNSYELIPKCRGELLAYECYEILNRKQSYNLLSEYNECIKKLQTCKNGDKIDMSDKCNGKVNCMDGSDETLETCAANQCFPSGFKCKYGACVYHAKCNGQKDCLDGSDELEELCHSDNIGLCVLPQFPHNGYYTSDYKLSAAIPGQALESVSLNYSCHSGYKLVGQSSSYCNRGIWSSNAPTCISQCWLNKHQSVEYICLPKGSNSQESGTECEELVEEGTVVRPKCRQPNYYYSGVLVNMHCLDGVWDQVTVCSPQCGLVSSQGEQLILGGRAAVHGELPWHAGIYSKTSKPYKQICGGSLVSSTAVISAAHCFWSNVEKQLPASRYVVAVGKLCRPWNNPRDIDAQKFDVKDIYIPARFQGAAANFQEDIAMVIVNKPFEFRTYVRPVCVDFDFNFRRRQLVAGALGKVAGWGLTTELGVSAPILQVIELPFVNIEQCISTSPPQFIEYITSDKFCAGYNNGTSRAVCKGDSGGGLSFTATERGVTRYYLRGLASTAPTNENLCNTQFYTTFTDISKHEEFIKAHL